MNIIVVSNIALIGYRGTGKTELGKNLAKRLKMKFIDADAEIMKESGMTINKIFRIEKGAGFRKREMKMVSKISGLDNCVIAAGGGVVLNPQNVENLKKNSVIILLEASPEKIYSRIRYDRTRPALTNKGMKEEIKQTLLERNDLYKNAADLVINAESDNISKKIDTIIMKLKSGHKLPKAISAFEVARGLGKPRAAKGQAQRKFRPANRI